MSPANYCYCSPSRDIMNEWVESRPRRSDVLEVRVVGGKKKLVCFRTQTIAQLEPGDRVRIRHYLNWDGKPKRISATFSLDDSGSFTRNGYLPIPLSNLCIKHTVSIRSLVGSIASQNNEPQYNEGLTQQIIESATPEEVLVRA